MLTILAESLLIATRTRPMHRETPQTPRELRDLDVKRKWYQFAGLKG